MRVCNSEENREKQFLNLKTLLLKRRYPEKKINSAIDIARKVPRAAALQNVIKTVKKNYSPIFTVTYDPRLPPLGQIQAKHWRSMTTRNI